MLNFAKLTFGKVFWRS